MHPARQRHASRSLQIVHAVPACRSSTGPRLHRHKPFFCGPLLLAAPYPDINRAFPPPGRPVGWKENRGPGRFALEYGQQPSAMARPRVDGGLNPPTFRPNPGVAGSSSIK